MTAVINFITLEASESGSALSLDETFESSPLLGQTATELGDLARNDPSQYSALFGEKQSPIPDVSTDDAPLVKRNPYVADQRPPAVSVLRFVLFLYVAGVSSCVFVIFLAFFVDVLVHLAFFYMVNGVWRSSFVGELGSGSLVLFLLVFMGYCLVDIVRFMLDMWDFRFSFENQFARFSKRVTNMIAAVPFFTMLSKRLTVLQTIDSPFAHKVRREIVMWSELGFILVNVILGFIIDTIMGGWVLGFYEFLVLIPVAAALVAAVLFLGLGWMTLLCRLLHVRRHIFDGKNYWLLQTGQKRPWAREFHPRKRPASFVWFVSVVGLIILPGFLVLGTAFVGYIVEFKSDAAQLEFFFVFLLLSSVVIVHFFWSLFECMLALPSWIGARARALAAFRGKELMLKVRKSVLIFLVLSVAFFTLLGVILAYRYDISTQSGGRPDHNKLRYPICGARWGTNASTLGVMDFALFSKLAYYDDGSTEFDTMFNRWFANGSDWEIVNITAHRSPKFFEFVRFVHAYSASRKMSVIAVRGTHAEQDVVQDLYLWIEIAVLKMLNVIFPLLDVLREDTVSIIVELMYRVTNWFFPAGSRTYISSLDDYVRDGPYDRLALAAGGSGVAPWDGSVYGSGRTAPRRRTRPSVGDLHVMPVLAYIDDIAPTFGRHNGTSALEPDLKDWGSVYLTGHSLGAGIAQIVGALRTVPAVAFSSPGLAYSRRKFAIDESTLFKSSVNVISYRDPVGHIDRQTGMNQLLDCTFQNPVECHYIDNVITELYRGCHLGTPPF